MNRTVFDTPTENPTMSATMNVTNGKPQRKQLADQLDRLDAILDALAEGLPAAVTDACREGARAAVKDAIIEIVTNPELRALLAPLPATTAPMPAPEPEPAPPAPPKPGLWGRVKAKLAAARAAVTGGVTAATEAVAVRCRTARNAVSALGAAAGEALRWKRALWVSAGVGLAVGATCLVAPTAVAAVVGAVGASATAVAVQTGAWLARAGRRFGLVS